MNRYRFGEEIEYKYNLLEADDFNNLQLFSCGNTQMDYHLHNEVIVEGKLRSEDGLYYKFYDEKTNEILAVVSLATSGILRQIGTYSHILPAIKIDIFAVDKRYQKMHFNEESQSSYIPDEHYYFSDEVIGNIIRRCMEISENFALAQFVVAYADVKAYRFYERNGFGNFENFMIEEHNMEVSKNIPMYLNLFE